jgi:hypothetical protein
MLLLIFGRCSFRISAETPVILTEGFHGCPPIENPTNEKNAKLHVFMKLTTFGNRALRAIFGPKREMK